MNWQSQKSEVARQLIEALGRHAGEIVAQTIVETSCTRSQVDVRSLRTEDFPVLAPELAKRIRLFVRDPQKQVLCSDEIARLAKRAELAPQLPKLLRVPIDQENGLLEARAAAREMATSLGFSQAETTQVATVVSELARNIALYATSGTITLISFPGSKPSLQINAEDKGPGIPNLETILNGAYHSKTGMGLGLRGSRKLVDLFDVQTGPGKGTRVVATKFRR